MKYVFLLNMGGANNLDECGEFLRNMFADKNILRMSAPLRFVIGRLIARARVAAMQENYRAIGGKSRLSELERSLCKKMMALAANPSKPLATEASVDIAAAAQSIAPEASGDIAAARAVIVDFISAYVPPRASTVLAKYDFKPDDEVVLLPLYPHFSTTTTKSSVEDFCAAYKGAARLKITQPFYEHPDYNQLLINQAKSLANADVLIISAHSLPLSIARSGDPYERHINEHFELLREQLAPYFEQIELAYQSKLGPIKWLEPSISQVLKRYEGRNVAVLPLSFCIDCSETDYELAIEYAREHEQSGAELRVCSCCNDSSDFARFLLELSEQAIDLSDFKMNY